MTSRHDDIPTAPMPAEARPTEPSPPPGAQRDAGESPAGEIAGYVIERPIGRGGQGVVYRATQGSTGQPVAIKFLAPKQAERFGEDRFEREFRIHAQLSHRNIIKIIDAGRTTRDDGEPGSPYYIMELVRGATPITRYAEQHGLSPEARIDLVARVCDAVDYLNHHGVIHLDLKPGNVLVDEHGEPRVGDFGMARRALGDSDQLSGSTPGYEAPEQRLGDWGPVDRRADVYALGVIQHQLLVGSLPIAPPASGEGWSGTREYLQKLRDEAPPGVRDSRPGIPRGVERAIARALAKRPADRFADAGEFAAELRRHSAPAGQEGERAARAIRRRAIGAAWTGGRVAIAVALGVALALTLGRKVTFEWTPAHAWYASLLGPPPSSLDRSMELTAVLGLTDETDLGGLFEAAGLEGYDPRDVYSLRTLHGWVCERLAVADPAAVVFDIRFGETSRAVAETEALARGVGALETAGIPVVMGSRSWFLDDEGRPDFAGAIWNAGADRGVIHALDPAGGDLLFMPIAAQRGETTHGMGLALAAFCAVRQPGTSPAFELEESLHRVDISYRAPSAGRPDLIVDLPERERVTLVSVNRLEGARRHGLLPGDLMGTYAPTVYSEEAVRGASLDYGELAEMGDDRLRRAVDGRVVVIGDRREGRDVRVSLAGRTVDGVDLHAMTIESLLRGAPLRAFNEPAAYLVVTLAALGGVFVALGCGVVTARLPRTLRRVGLSHAVRWGVLVGVSAALVVIAVQAYRLEGIVMNALIAAIALIVASELAALLFPRRPIARTA